MKIGFIGLGNMGAPMAANLVRAGHDVTGFDPAEVVGVGPEYFRAQGQLEGITINGLVILGAYP
ncbi:MAG: NAD(P)-binding domain-containing protein, partial [Pseudomonadota bacterium]